MAGHQVLIVVAFVPCGERSSRKRGQRMLKASRCIASQEAAVTSSGSHASSRDVSQSMAASRAARRLAALDFVADDANLVF